MLKRIRDALRSILEIILHGSKRSSETYIHYLRKQGVSIGENTVFYEPLTNVVDTTTPKLLTIGKNVRITRGVVILTHDYSWSVIAGVYGECLGGIGPVVIGDNVFIGMNACILKGVTIGDNVIIGTGSVVTKDCESNSVYAGNPAKKVMTLEQFRNKKLQKMEEDVRKIVLSLRDEPEEEIIYYLREHCCLFQDLDSSMVKKQMKATGYYDKCRDYYATKPRYNGFSEMIQSLNIEL